MKHSNADEAIRLAMQGRWEEAAAVNRSTIEVAPEDVDAHNRLGKALAELGQYVEARQAYEHAVELDPTNIIARKNVQRLSHMKDGEQPRSKETVLADSQFFIEETGKARITNLQRAAARGVLSAVSPGDQAHLQVQGQKLMVTNQKGEYLGEVEPGIGSRLIELMEGGNQYQAAIVSLRDDRVKLIVRETFQHPSQVGHLSFPPRGAEDMKPYLKDMFVKYEAEEEEVIEPEEVEELEGEPEAFWEEEAPVEEDIPEIAREDEDLV